MSAQTAPTQPTQAPRRLTVADIARMYADGERLATLTAYDAPTAGILDEAGIPLLLVGDSVAQVMLGYDSTVRVSMDEMLHHTRAVVRGSRRALVVADMPFLAYADPAAALENAGRFLRDAGAQAVKVEGGVRTARVIEALVRAGIPVMGHIGWTPQSEHGMGGKVRVQGKSRAQARALLADAFAVQEAGAFSVVLELVPEQLAAAITGRLRIPTIGIGAGAGCAGQIQVVTDLLGLGSFIPRHARPYATLRETIRSAAEAYAADVRAGSFPGSDQASRMDDAVLAEVLGRSPLDATGETGAEAAEPLGIPLDRDL
jgi:3-methyl-2-oxobutanoate hydroxymethyltransferase